MRTDRICKFWEDLFLKMFIFCVEGPTKILDFGYFVLIWWQTGKKQEILMQGPIYLDITANGLIKGLSPDFSINLLCHQ